MSSTNAEAPGVAGPTVGTEVANPATGDTETSAIIVNAWCVTDGCQEEFLEAIVELFEYARALDGFLAGEVLRGANPTRFVTYLRMRSPQDRQRLLDDREVSATLRSAERIARPDLHSYDLVRAFSPART